MNNKVKEFNKKQKIPIYEIEKESSEEKNIKILDSNSTNTSSEQNQIKKNSNPTKKKKDHLLKIDSKKKKNKKQNLKITKKKHKFLCAY